MISQACRQAAEDTSRELNVFGDNHQVVIFRKIPVAKFPYLDFDGVSRYPCVEGGLN